MLNPTTINSLKYDGSLNRTWQANLVKHENSLLVFRGEFSMGVDHPLLGKIKKGTISVEYFWLDRWFNVFRFHNPDGTFRCFYCNVNKPPKFANFKLEYVDLDIDLLADKDLNYSILDVDEFEENRLKYGYSDLVLANTKSAVSSLERMLESREFPFSVDKLDQI